MRSIGWYSRSANSGARSIISLWIATAEATRDAPPTEAVRTPSSEITSQLKSDKWQSRVFKGALCASVRIL